MGCAVVGAVRAGGSGSAGMTARKNTSLSQSHVVCIRFWVVLRFLVLRSLVLLLLCFFKDDAEDPEDDAEDEDKEDNEDADDEDKEDVEDMVAYIT